MLGSPNQKYVHTYNSMTLIMHECIVTTYSSYVYVPNANVTINKTYMYVLLVTKNL